MDFYEKEKMKATKYIKLDQELIRKSFPNIFAKYEGTYVITAVPGTKIDVTKLKPNESVCWGDGESFHFLLTKVSTSPPPEPKE